MTYEIIWTGHTRAVETGSEAEAVLDEISVQASTAALPFAVTVLPAGSQHPSPFDDDFPECLEAGIGDPKHAFVRWLGDGGGYGYEADCEPGPKGLRFDYGGQPIHPEPQELRVTPQLARQAVCEFIVTGKRPAGLQWAVA